MKTLLLFAVLALSMNAFAQSKGPETILKHSAINAIEIKHGSIFDAALKTTGLYSGMNLLQTIKSQESAPLPAIQVIDSSHHWQWDTDINGWKIQTKSVNMVYDDNNNLKSELVKKWNGSAWEDSLNIAYAYNNQNSLVSMSGKYWNGSTWVNYSKSSFSYDANNNMISSETQYWNGNTWDNFMKFTFTYVANNNTSMLLQTGNGSAWDNLSQSTYTYDAKNNLTSEISLAWNNTAWDSTSKSTWTYDASDKMISGLEKSYTDNNTWVDYMKTSYTYTGNNLTTELQQLWAETFWMDMGKINYSYDANNNLINELHLGSNFISWFNTQQHLYTYDANNFETGESNKYWSYGGTSIITGDSTHFYFHTTATGLPGLKEADVSVYPNPAKGKFTVGTYSAITAIEIFTLSGKRIYSDFNMKQQTSKEIDLSGYAKGVYILKIYSGTKYSTRKVILQ